MSYGLDLKVLLIGHALAVGPIETALHAWQADNYVCVDSVETANMLIADGFSPDLVIADHGVFAKPAALIAWRGANPGIRTIVLPHGEGSLERIAGAVDRAVRRVAGMKMAYRAPQTVPPRAAVYRGPQALAG